MSEPAAMKCPNCAAVITAEQWNAEQGFAKCGYCRAMVSLPGIPRSGFRPRPQMPLPPGMSIVASGGGVVIIRRWFSWIVIFLIPFCLAWNGFLFGWFSMTGSAPVMFKLLPLVHVMVGVVLAYFCLAILFNRTWIKAENGVVSVLHGPLPWPGNRVLPCADIDQLFCREKVSHGKNGSQVRYELWAALKAGATQKVLDGITINEDQALYIEQQLEKALGISDRAMPGEMLRR